MQKLLRKSWDRFGLITLYNQPARVVDLLWMIL